MPTVETSIDIGAPLAPLFALAQDYALRLEWDPFLRDVRFPDGETAAQSGVRVWVRAHNRLSMEVRYTTFEPPEKVAMVMTQGPRFFTRFSGAWSFRALDAQRTRVVFKYGFATRPAVLRGIMEPAIAWTLRRDMQARLEGLKRAAEGGMLDRL